MATIFPVCAADVFKELAVKFEERMGTSIPADEFRLDQYGATMTVRLESDVPQLVFTIKIKCEEDGVAESEYLD